MAHLHLPPDWQGRPRDVTSEETYLERRAFLKTMGFAGAGALALLAGCGDDAIMGSGETPDGPATDWPRLPDVAPNRRFAIEPQPRRSLRSKTRAKGQFRIGLPHRGTFAVFAQLGARRSAILILWLTVILAILAYVYYNSEFLQTQGRYLFPALIPIGLGMAVGLDAWRRLLTHWMKGRRVPDLRWTTALAYLPLAGLDIYVLWRFIVPLLSP